MKNYKKSNYAVNKNSKNIVYISQKTGASELTLEKFLASDPQYTKADFEYWKNWSDEDYREEDRGDNRVTKNNVSIENLTEVLSVLNLTTEEEYENNQLEISIKKALREALKRLYSDRNFTSKMRTRFERYYFDNISTTKIAKEECVNSKTVSESINSAVAKLKKYFYETLSV